MKQWYIVLALRNPKPCKQEQKDTKEETDSEVLQEKWAGCLVGDLRSHQNELVSRKVLHVLAYERILQG